MGYAAYNGADNEIQQRVVRGAQLLDRIRPGWELKIDLGELEMDSCYNCIVGQAVCEYGQGLYILGIDDMEEHAAAEHGFTSMYYDEILDMRDYHTLVPYWLREEIRQGEWMALHTEWANLVKKRLDAGIAV